MKLYNTLSRKIETLQPLNDRRVSLYTCGPTVYLEPHIGNWRTFIYYDVLHRALQSEGYEVKHVLNITDVGHLVSDGDDGDDKIAQEAHKERLTAWQVADKYTQLFYRGLADLNIDQHQLTIVKATDEINEQIKLIQRLEQAGTIYVIDDGVYMDTAKVKAYGKLAGFSRDQQQAGARVEMNPQKRHHADFALWKLSPKGQQRDMEWDSPWGTGFPGWHLECSAIIMKHLGDTIDIHAGGVDHIGVHHTNEIAQSETATGKPLANIWLHTEHLMVNGAKIAKSAGNGYLLHEVAAKAPLAAFRLAMLQSHYRSQQNFSWDSLQAAKNLLQRIQGWADLRFQLPDNHGRLPDPIAVVAEEFQLAIRQDLDTPQALAILSHLIDLTENQVEHLSSQNLQKLVAPIEQILGLGLLDSSDISDEQKDLIADRETARKSGDYQGSDAIRERLLGDGIELNDTPSGARWRRLAKPAA